MNLQNTEYIGSPYPNFQNPYPYGQVQQWHYVWTDSKNTCRGGTDNEERDGQTAAIDKFKDYLRKLNKMKIRF